MAYRDDAHSLRAYRDRVSAELEDARRAAREARERAKTVEKLEEDLAAVEAKLASFEQSGGRRVLPSLEDMRVASPCNASWEDMKGDDRVRFCGKCEKNVFNLSAMPREEAEALLADRAGNLCVRFYKRADGTVLTEDCPVGAKHRRRVRLAIAAVGGGLMAAATAASLAGAGHHCEAGVVQGGLVIPQEDPAERFGIPEATQGEILGPEPTGDPSGHWVAGGISPTAVKPPPTVAAPPPHVPQQAPVRPIMGKPSLDRVGK
jgi:hypothetical protein